MGLPRVPSDVLEKALPKLEKLLAEVVTDIPETVKTKTANPEEVARGLAAAAGRRAALISGTLALPSGPLGVLTLIPDLVGVWRLQAQLVADIAGVYGQTTKLDKELMTYCLFRHVSEDAVKDIVVRAGQRLIVSPMSIIALYRVLRMVAGRRIALMAGLFMVRWLPVLGAGSMAAYSYSDTKTVGETAIQAFRGKPAPETGRRHSRKGGK